MYIKISTEDYPISLQAIRAEFNSTAFPDNPTDEQLEPFDYANVTDTPLPEYNLDTQRLEEIDPTNDGNGYEKAWDIVSLTEEEINQRKTQLVSSVRRGISLEFQIEANASVESSGETWNGGYDSASKLNNKAEALIFNSDDTGIIYDIDNVPHNLSPTEIKQIAFDISVQYEAAFAKYQSAKVQIAACGNDFECIRLVTY